MSFRTPALGSLNSRIELFSRNQTIDATGGSDTTLISMGWVWANVSTGTASPSDVAGGNGVTERLNITIRYSANLVAGDRLKFNDIFYDVVSVSDPNNRRAYQLLLATKIEQLGTRYD